MLFNAVDLKITLEAATVGRGELGKLGPRYRVSVILVTWERSVRARVSFYLPTDPAMNLWRLRVCTECVLGS